MKKKYYGKFYDTISLLLKNVTLKQIDFSIARLFYDFLFG